MDRRKFGLAAITMVLGALPLGCASASDETRTYRYRLTVEVETPEGVRTGSSVIQVIGDEAGKNALISPGRLTFRIFGEAVEVDLKNGKKLFAVLSRPNGTNDAAASYAPSAYGAPYFDKDYPRQLAEWLKKQHRIAVLPPRNSRNDLKISTDGPNTIERVGLGPVDPFPTNYPMLVTFSNLSDPTTVVAVDARHLDRTFGPGFRFRRITTEITDAPVTRNLETKLPWVKSFMVSDSYIGGQRFIDSKTPEKNLIPIDFVSEQR